MPDEVKNFGGSLVLDFRIDDDTCIRLEGAGRLR